MGIRWLSAAVNCVRLEAVQRLCAHNLTQSCWGWGAGPCQTLQWSWVWPLGCEEQSRAEQGGRDVCILRDSGRGWVTFKLSYFRLKTLRGSRGAAINTTPPPDPHRDPQTGQLSVVYSFIEVNLHYQAPQETWVFEDTERCSGEFFGRIQFGFVMVTFWRMIHRSL